MTVRTEKFTTATELPAGTFYVGDPCYGFTSEAGEADNVWMEWLNTCYKNSDQEDPNRVMLMDGEVRGLRVVASGTKYGDGGYEDQYGRVYGVDAGLIGVIPASGWVTTDETPRGMHKVEFPTPFHIGYDDGTITIGDIAIETGWLDDDDDDE